MNRVQVPRWHYFEPSYDDVARFISYQQQIAAVRATGARRVLEVGIGNGTVADYLRKVGCDVVTCDHDAALKPDLVADVRRLPLPEADFDVVVAAEVIEHLPFGDVPAALAELHRVTREWGVLSIPYDRGGIEVAVRIRLPKLRTRLGTLRLALPYVTAPTHFGGEHYWVMGRRGYPRRRIRRMLEERFEIVREFSPPVNFDHVFFVLRRGGVAATC